MAEQKQRAPFRSSVTDFDALRRRMDELGIDRLGTKNGIDVTAKKPAPPEPEPKPDPGHYNPGYY